MTNTKVKIELIKETFVTGEDKFWIYRNDFPVDGAENETMARTLYNTYLKKEKSTKEVLISTLI